MKILWVLVLIGTWCQAAVIRGVVSAPEQRTVSGAKIVVFSELSFVVVRKVTTDRNGFYQVALAPGSYHVMVLKQGFGLQSTKVLLTSDQMERVLNHELVEEISSKAAENQSIRNLKHMLRRSNREPLLDLRQPVNESLALQDPRESGLSGTISNVAGQGERGDTNVSRIALQTALGDRLLLDTDVVRGGFSQDRKKQERLQVHAGVEYQAERFSVAVRGSRAEGDGRSLCPVGQRWELQSRFQGGIEGTTTVAYHDVEQRGPVQESLAVEQDVRHRIEGHLLEHHLMARAWSDEALDTMVLARYGVDWRPGKAQPVHIRAGVSHLKAGERPYASEEVRVGLNRSWASTGMAWSSELGWYRGQESCWLGSSRLASRFGPVRIMLCLDQNASVEALQTSDVWGSERDFLAVPFFVENVYEQQSKRAAIEVASCLGDWQGNLSLAALAVEGRLLSTHALDQYWASAERETSEARYRMENAHSRSAVELVFAVNKSDTLSFEQQQLVYDQHLVSLSSRIPELALEIMVSTQPELPGWWLLKDPGWNPNTSDTYYQGQLRMFF